MSLAVLFLYLNFGERIMQTKSDEQIIYDSYMKLGKRFSVNNKRKYKHSSLSADKNMISRIIPGISLTLLRLENDQLTSCKQIKTIRAAKNYYIQICQIKGRHPECIQPSLSEDMEKLVKALCGREAELISLFRMQVFGGDRLDIESIFSDKAVGMLASVPANEIVKRSLTNTEKNVGKRNTKLYITQTGMKYHIKDCPYCKGKVISETSKAMIDNMNLKPCKCIDAVSMIDCNDYATAFIDESMHTVEWDESGNRGKISSFSYIICRGKLLSEKEINSEVIIAEGVDYVNENMHVDKITEAAIAKVMFSLLYDYDFNGYLTIYTDNLIAKNNWTSISKNIKLGNQFESVKVVHIPREENKRADAIGRSKVFLCIPTSEYTKVAHKVKKYDELIELQEIEKQKRIQAEEEEKERRQNKPWNNILRWICLEEIRITLQKRSQRLALPTSDFQNEVRV